jgi:hypothetical protein
MSSEWLQKLAEISNDKGLMARARRAQRGAAQRSAPRQPGRGLIGALVAFFFRLVVILAVVEAAVMLVVANIAGITQEPLGYIFHYAVWAGLVEGLGEVGLYDSVRPTLEQLGNAAPFLAPLAGALAGTIYFLPSINAARLRNPIRVVVYIINLIFGWSLFGWIIALVISLITGLGRTAATTAAPAPGRPAAAPTGRRAPATASGGSPAARRPSHEPAVVRRGGPTASWIRPR